MEKLTEKELMCLIDKLVEEKLEIDDKFLRFTFYEVMVKNKVSNQQEDEFLNLAKNKLNNMRYTVYFQEQQFIYNEARMRVQPNELLIAMEKIEEKYKKQSIDRFEFISEENLNKLRTDNVKTLGQLANKTSKDLKKYGFENFEIKEINRELQFLGLSLKNSL